MKSPKREKRPGHKDRTIAKIASGASLAAAATPISTILATGGPAPGAIYFGSAVVAGTGMAIVTASLDRSLKRERAAAMPYATRVQQEREATESDDCGDRQ
jgi:hypothetical protein